MVEVIYDSESLLSKEQTLQVEKVGSGVGGGVKIKYGGKDKDLKGNPQKQWMKPTETSEQATNRLAEFVEASDFKGREQSAFIDKDGENIEVKLRNDNGKWNWYYPKSKKPFASFDTAKDAIKFIQEQPFWDNGELNKNGRDDAYFAKVKAEQIKRELENGNILEDIKDGKISVQNAKAIIENTGLEVPKDIINLATKEQSLPTQEAKAEQPTVSEPAKTEISGETLKQLKPAVKMEFLTNKELVDSKDPLGNKQKHDDIKERFKELKKIIDCLWKT